MNTPAPPPVDPGLNGSTAVARLGFTRDQVVQEFGYDSDVDDEFRFAVEDLCGAEMEDEDLVTRVKQTYHYQADRVRKALSQLPDEEG